MHNLKLLPLVLAGSVTIQAQDTVEVAVVITSDIAGQAYHWDYLTDREARGGLTRFASLLDSVNAVMENRVIAIDAGNSMSGSPFSTYYETARRDLANPLADAMLALQYDVVSPGIAEIRPGADSYLQAMQPTRIPVVASNLFGPDNQPVADPHMTLVRSGISVGVVSHIARRSGLDSVVVAAGGLTLLDAESIPTHLARIDPASLRVLVVNTDDAASLPVDAASSTGATPHIIVRSGRGRATLTTNASGIPVVHADSTTAVAVTVTLEVSGSTANVLRTEPVLISFANAAPQTQLARRLEGAHEDVRRWSTTSVAAAQGEWESRPALIQDTPLQDFVNEVLLATSQAQLAASRVNDADIAFGPGPVRMNDLMALHPSRSRLVAIGVSGRQLRLFLERSAEHYSLPPDIPGLSLANIVSGVEYTIDISRPEGNRVTSLRFQGEEVADSDVFSMALDERIMTGEFPGYEFLHNREILRSWRTPIQDLIVEYTTRAGTLVHSDYFQPSWQLQPDSLVRNIRSALGFEVEGNRPSLRVVVLTDTGELLDDPARLATVKSWLDSLESSCGCQTFPVVTGTVFGGSTLNQMTDGRAAFDALDAMSVAAVVPSDSDLRESDSLSQFAPTASFPIIGDSSLSFVSGSRRLQGRDASIDVVKGDPGGTQSAISFEGELARLYSGGRSTGEITLPASGAEAVVVDVSPGFDGTEFSSHRVTLNPEAVEPDALIPEVLSTHEQRVAQRAGRFVARLVLPGTHNPSVNSRFGNLIADGVRNETETRLAIVAHSEEWTDLASDTLTYANLRRAYGRTRIRVLEMSGHEIRSTLDANLGSEMTGVWISGVLVRYRPARDQGDRVRDVRTPDNRRLDNDDMYTVALVGDVDIPSIVDRDRVPRGDMLLADALATYISLLPQPVAYPENRRVEVD